MRKPASPGQSNNLLGQGSSNLVTAMCSFNEDTANSVMFVREHFIQLLHFQRSGTDSFAIFHRQNVNRILVLAERAEQLLFHDFDIRAHAISPYCQPPGNYLQNPVGIVCQKFKLHGVDL